MAAGSIAYSKNWGGKIRGCQIDDTEPQRFLKLPQFDSSYMSNYF